MCDSQDCVSGEDIRLCAFVCQDTEAQTISEVRQGFRGSGSGDREWTVASSLNLPNFKCLANLVGLHMIKSTKIVP